MTTNVPNHTAPRMTTHDDPAVEAGHLSYEERGALGLITLTRPKALNALTHDMILSLDRKLGEWAGKERIETIAIRGEGKAFSAGGDIRAIYERGRAGEPFDQFFADEYALNIRIKRYPKPYVALIDGLAMGGGVGVSYHGSHRVISENARFAMPECGIGFYPDVGATYMLPRLPEGFGFVIMMTGARVARYGQLESGLATAGVSSTDFPDLIEAFASGEAADDAVRARSETLGDHPHQGWPHQHVGNELTVSDTFLFRYETGRSSFVEAASLTHTSPLPWGDKNRHLVDGDAFHANKTRMNTELIGKCPISLSVAYRALQLGRDRTFEQCMGLEARMTHRMLREPDFYEGIRAAIIDKDRAPEWSVSDIKDVTEQMVERYFEPVASGPLAELSALYE